MTRVAFIDHDSGRSGSTVSLEGIVRHFVRRGCEVTVISAKADERCEIYRRDGARAVSVACPMRSPLFLDLHFTCEATHSPVWATKRFVQFLRHFSHGARLVLPILKSLQPDLVYVNEYVSINAAVAARLLGIPAIVHIRSRIGDGAFGLRKFVTMRAAELCTDRLIAITGIEAQLFSSLARRKTTVIHEFIGTGERQLDTIPAGAARTAICHEYGLPADVPIVSMLGGIWCIKGTLDFIRAAYLVRQRSPRARFVIAGEHREPTSAYHQACLDFLKAHALEDCVRIVGLVEKPMELLQISDVVVSPNTDTHFSRPIIEAWALKKAIVATATAHTEELVRDGVDGLVVGVGDVSGMAGAILRLLDDEGLRHSTALAGFDHATRAFSEEENLGAIYALAEQVARQGN